MSTHFDLEQVIHGAAGPSTDLLLSIRIRVKGLGFRV